MRGGCVVHRCQNKNPRTRGCEWRHEPEARAEDFGDFEKVSCVLWSEEEGWLSLARSVLLADATRVGVGADEKASIERLCISLNYVETFNSKVIKGFVPELRSPYVFFCASGFLCSMYICYEHSMYVSHIRIMGMVHTFQTRDIVLSDSVFNFHSTCFCQFVISKDNWFCFFWKVLMMWLSGENYKHVMMKLNLAAGTDL